MLKERILKTNKLLLKYFTTVVENINKDIDVIYFINNDSNVTDDFNYFMIHALKKPIFRNEL
jgi:hypothetical protein